MPTSDSTRLVDLTGQKLGRWTVLSPLDDRRFGSPTWHCRSECGLEKAIRSDHLRCGRTKGCRSCAAKNRASRAADLTGSVFGRWTVLGPCGIRSNRQRTWNCRCECGDVHEIAGGDLRNGRSAGCQKCKSRRQEKLAYSRLYHFAKTRAKERGLEFAITKEYALALLDRQDFKCALTGLPLEVALSARKHMRGGTSASLDRIDSSKGYVVGNVQWLHKDVNRMKWILSESRFIEICRSVVRMHGMGDNEQA
jgi:hypothetical protein